MLFRKVVLRIDSLRKWEFEKLEWIKQKKTSSYSSERIVCSRRRGTDMFAPMNVCGSWLSGKVSFCTSGVNWKKASLAVETAMVLPLFFMGMVTIISFMDVYKLETEKLVKLCEHVKEAGMYAYVLDESGPEEITLPDFYSYEPIGGWLPLPRVWLHNVVKAHAWTGKEPSAEGENEENAEETEEMVWVTENGQVYHVNPMCSYLDLSIKETSGSYVGYRRNIYGEHYDACETCSRNQAPAGTVFITDSGTSYHNLESCSGLKRTARMVTESQVEGMHVCSRCG